LANGLIVAIRAPGASIDGVWTGQVKVYYQRIDNDGTSWVQLGKSMYGNNAEDWFGESIDISPKGHTLPHNPQKWIYKFFYLSQLSVLLLVPFYCYE
jgi:hypothetical protein